MAEAVSGGGADAPRSMFETASSEREMRSASSDCVRFVARLRV
jgi:hypothetical protein